MIRTLFFFVVFWLYQILISPILLVLLLRARWGNEAEARKCAGHITYQWARRMMAVAGARFTVQGEVGVPEDQPVLFISNHQGAFDIPLAIVAARRPVAFMAKQELGRLPLIGGWMKLMGCLLVDRGNRNVARQSADDAVAALKKGVSLVVFPEGTRSDSDEMRRFKSGFARIAKEARVPIVPMIMKGTHRLKQKDASWITPAQVEMALKPAILPDEFMEMRVPAIRERVEQIIRDELGAPLKSVDRAGTLTPE